MKMIKIGLCCSSLLLLNSVAGYAQDGSAVCLAMVTDAAHSISVSTTSDAYFSSLYSNFCNADGSTNDSAINASGSGIIDAIPVGLKGGSSDVHTQWQQFCSTEQSAESSSSRTYDYQSEVISQALASANQCLKILSDHAYTMTYKVMTPDTMVVNLGIPSGQSIVIHGVAADKNVKCSGSDLKKGGSFLYSQGVGQTVNASDGSTSIRCERAPLQNVGNTSYYKEASVEVDTNVGQLNIFWPQETIFPLTTASKIQAEIKANVDKIAGVQGAVKFNALPIGAIVPWDPQGGTLPAGWVKCDGSDTAHCPNLTGLFLRGASVTALKSPDGQDSYPVAQHGSDHRRPDGNGWSIDGSHFLSNDQVTVKTIPRYVPVLYIMKIANE